MIPDDLWRHIGSFLRVKEAVGLENALVKNLHSKEHYLELLYKESYSRLYIFNTRKINIETYRICGVVFSLVKPLPKSDFVIRHTDEISTREANKRAYDALCIKEGKVLRRRLEMVGWV